MAHITSDTHLFDTEDDLRDGITVAADALLIALLIALQREHPEIVRRLQTRAAANRKPIDTETPS